MMEAYKLTMYKEFQHGGHAVRLNIYEKKDDGDMVFALPIGDVLQGLEYGIQGRDGEFAPAIQKTSLSMVLIDAPDMKPDQYISMWGGWEIFYTNDATRFRVDLLIDGVLEWSGYVTPDSYEEDLMHHAAISITARDNWGRLNDFEFDHKGDEFGMVSVIDLVRAAAEKAGVAMSVVVNDSAAWPTCDGVKLYDHMVNVKAFEDGTWWEAVADTLEGLGISLTFKGKASFDLAPVRGVVLKGHASMDDVPASSFVFEAPGHRSLSPAVKEIVEKTSFEISDDMLNADEMSQSSFVAGAGFPYTTQPYGVVETTLPVFALGGDQFWKNGSGSYYSLLNPYNYTTVEGDDDVRLHDGKTLFLACNPGTAADYATAYKKMRGVYARVPMTMFKATIQFSCGQGARLYDGKMLIGTAPVMENYVSPMVQDIVVRMFYTTDSGTVFYYDGAGWLEGEAQAAFIRPAEGSYTCDIEIPSPDIEVSGILTMSFLCGHYIVRGEYDQEQDGDGVYMPISDIRLVPTRAQKSTDKVTTKYAETNNVILSRSPRIACVNFDTTAPAEVINGVYAPGSGRPAARVWSFSDEEVALPVLIHQQLLCWYARPMNVLTGTLIVNQLKDYPSYGSLYTWKDREFVLTDGRVDLISGRMKNAQLREFIRYEEMW
jgi:hypothetical protein